MTGGEPLVSVVVPTYNSAHFLGETLDGVLAQEYGNWELIVVDDGSTDNTPEVVEPYLRDSRVRYELKPNGGVASARNLGLSLARGELTAFCDSDDVWRPDKLAKQVPLFADPEVVLVYSGADLIFPDGSLKPIPDRYYDEGHCFETLVLHNYITNSTAVVRMSAVEKVGRFDERRDLQGLEDKHLWIRLSTVGLVRAVREPLVIYRITRTGVSSHYERMLNAELLCLADIREKTAPHADPEVYRRAFRRIHYQYGKYLFFGGRYPAARQALLGAWSNGLHTPRLMGLIALTMLPGPVLGGALRLKRRLVG